MMRQKYFLLITLAVMLCTIAGPANAERLYSRISQGNNVGLGIIDEWGGPLNWASWATQCQFPRGSGNFITNDGCQWPVNTVRDLDGNGTPEDTAATGDGGRAFMAYYSSIWAEEQLAALVGGPVNMETASTNRSGTDINQVWTSVDVANLATWPREARVGYSPTGDPILKGAETIFSHFGDSFNSWTENNGFYMGMRFHFPDFGEANNMVFCHVLLHQVTHYVKWRPSMPAKYLASPDGWTWDEMVMNFNQRAFRYAGSDLRWAFHPAREITALWAAGTVSSFTPAEPPIIAYRMIAKPKFEDQEMQLTNFWTADRDYGGGFGYAGGTRMPNLAYPLQHRSIKAEYPEAFQGVVNPFTGKGDMRGWPGMLTPDDQRFDQWLWGAKTVQQNTCYAAIQGMEPRDTTSFDFVIMFVPAEGRTINPPPLDIANMDDPTMQQAFQRVLDYDEVAQALYDIDLAGPETPKAPALTIIPGDREVTITWSDINVKTPDSFYYILEQNDWNPDGYYREYDFEGYRLYRSYVGPNDSHIDKDYDGNITPLFECSMSAGNLQFYYIDRLEDDTNYNRMRNGMKVWYALVPYDRNYNQTTGEQFSLPLLSSGKIWNRSGTENAYNVIPRSEASNFRAAGVEGEITFAPANGNPVFATSQALTGDGTGLLTQAPVYLAPVGNFEFTPVTNEKITSARTAVVETSGLRVSGAGENYSFRQFTLKDGSYSTQSGEKVVRRRNQASAAALSLSGPVDANGAMYSLDAEFEYMSDGDYRTRLVKNMNTGSYAGATLDIYVNNTNANRKGGHAPGHPGQIRAGRYTLTWQSSGAGLTLAVMDVTRGSAVNFVEFPDDYGWGFVTLDNFGTTWSGDGTLFTDMRTGKAKSSRTVKMVSSLPASNTAEFGIWINGILWSVRNTAGVTMPSAGTIFTLDNAWGTWNTDKTEFTQLPDPPYPGDKWTINIKPSTLSADDIDLSKIKVVPNPYIATSYLDLSPMNRRIDFVNLPDRCTIRIYTLGGNLVNVLNHIGASRQGWGNYTDWDRLVDSEPKVFTGYDNHGGTEPWNLRNRFGATVASGLYFFHVTDERGNTFTGKFYVVL